MSHSDTHCGACGKIKNKNAISPAMLIPKLPVYVNWIYIADGKRYFYDVYAKLSTNILQKEKKTPHLWVYGEINLLFSQLITSKMHVYQLSVTLSLWWITCIMALLPIWFVFLAVLITKLHCWCIGFLHRRLMALMNKRENPTSKKKNAEKNKWRNS